MIRYIKYLFIILIFFSENIKSQSTSWADTLISNSTKNFDLFLSEAMGDSVTSNPGSAFVSICLRNHPFNSKKENDVVNGIENSTLKAYVTEGPDNEDCEIQLRCALERRGFLGPYYNAELLKKGDIVFTEDKVPFENELWPTNAFIFIEWVNPNSFDYAYVIDYHGPYIKRNITVDGEYVKFQYFLRSPFNKKVEDVALISNLTDDIQFNIYPNPVKDFVKIGTADNVEKIEIFNQLGQLIFSKNIKLKKNEFVVNCSKWVKGIYFMKIKYSGNKGNSQIYTKKIIKIQEAES